MVATTPRNSIPYPRQGDSPNEATAMANMVAQIDRRLIPRFASSAARDAAIPSPSDGMIIWHNGATVKAFQVWRAGAWRLIGPMRTVFKPTDTTRTTTITNTADPHLTVPGIFAGRTYSIECCLLFSADAAVDATVRLNAPAGTTGRVMAHSSPVTPTGGAGTQTLGNRSSTMAAPPSAAFTVGTFGGSGSGGILMRGIFTTTNAGSITVEWAQAVSSALGTTLQAGSYMTVAVVG